MLAVAQCLLAHLARLHFIIRLMQQTEESLVRKNYKIIIFVMSSDGICKYLSHVIRSYVLACVRLLFRFVLVKLQHCGKPITCI